MILSGRDKDESSRYSSNTFSIILFQTRRQLQWRSTETSVIRSCHGPWTRTADLGRTDSGSWPAVTGKNMALFSRYNKYKQIGCDYNYTLYRGSKTGFLCKITEKCETLFHIWVLRHLVARHLIELDYFSWNGRIVGSYSFSINMFNSYYSFREMHKKVGAKSETVNVQLSSKTMLRELGLNTGSIKFLFGLEV